MEWLFFVGVFLLCISAYGKYLSDEENKLKEAEKIAMEEKEKEEKIKKEKRRLEIEKTGIKKFHHFKEMVLTNSKFMEIYINRICDFDEYEVEELNNWIKSIIYDLPNDFSVSDIEKFGDRDYLINNSILTEDIIYKFHIKIPRSLVDFGITRKEYDLFSIYQLFNIAIEYIWKIANLNEFTHQFLESDLYIVYKNLLDTSVDNKYISSKINELHNSLYNDNKYSIREMQFLLSYIDSIDIDEEIYMILSKNIRMQSKDFDEENFRLICNEVINNKEINTSLELIDKNFYNSESNKQKIFTAILKLFNIDEKFDIFLNANILYSILKEIISESRKNKKKMNAQSEIQRILNKDFSKEIEFQKLELDYTNIKNGYEFEEYVSKLYEKLGYEVEEVTRKSGDQGADVIVNKDGKKYVIQAKFYNSPVSNKAVQEVVAAIGMYKADKGIVVTNNRFTDSAIELAKANNIELVNGNKIEEFKKEILAKI